jgi:hypothetical protein
VSTLSLPFKLTAAGLDASFNLGAIALNVTHVQTGSGNRLANGNEVALVTPQETAVISGHFEVSAGQHRIAAIVAGSASVYTISEIGLWSGVPGAGGSVLVFYWSLATGYITVKSAGIDFNFEDDITFGGVVPGNITIVADTQFNSLAMLAAHEADLNAHPAFTTPPLFDNDTSPATTEFIQRALGNLAGFFSLDASTTISLAELGKCVQVANTTPPNQIITLPLLATVDAGYGYWIENLAPYPVTIKGYGSESILLGGSSFNSFLLNPRETAFVHGQSIQWTVFGAIAAQVFQSSLTASGWQKLPSGLIVQWGAFDVTSAGQYPQTFPVAFPTALYCLTLSAQYNLSTIPNVWYGNSSVTSFTGQININTGDKVTWLAIGK